MPDPLHHPSGSKRPRHCGRGPRFSRPLSRMSARQRQRSQLLYPAASGSPVLRARDTSRFGCGASTAAIRPAQSTPSRNLCLLPPCLLKPYARRTQRLAKAQGRIGIALGGEPSARLLVHLATPASSDTVLRLVRRQPRPARRPPRIVGVDDWAMKKGRTYGSILVDLEYRKPIELLPDRTASTFSAWLRRYPDIEIIAVTAPESTPEALPRLPRPFRWRTDGICCSMRARWWSVGWRQPMPGCGVCPLLRDRLKPQGGEPTPIHARGPSRLPVPTAGPAGRLFMRKSGSDRPEEKRCWRSAA